MDSRNRCSALIFRVSLRLQQLIPITIVFVIGSYVYYAYVFKYIPALTYVPLRFILEVIIHAVIFLWCWSYHKTITTPLLPIPSQFHFSEDDLQALLREDPRIVSDRLLVKTLTKTGELRVCRECNIVKPDRAHHCDVCKTCVLKMDHHCPWVCTCVGFHNYKFFVLFLFYTFLWCFVVALSVLPVYSGHEEQMVLLVISTLLGFSTGGMLVYHIQLTRTNTTTHESLRKPFFLEPLRWVQDSAVELVFGPSSCIPRMLPLFSWGGNGIDFATEQSRDGKVAPSSLEAVVSISSNSSSNRRGASNVQDESQEHDLLLILENR